MFINITYKYMRESVKPMKQQQATIHRLVICHTCHERIRLNEPYTIWEDAVYCEPCFDIYLELVGPENELEKTTK
jgi:formylmethanofuran dehydrogenase subunit E